MIEHYAERQNYKSPVFELPYMPNDEVGYQRGFIDVVPP